MSCERVRHGRRAGWWRLAVTAYLGCASCTPPGPGEIDAVDGFGALDGSMDGGGLDPEPLAFGVVASDYTAASVTLLDPEGEILQADFVHSGSATAGLVTALSGDVVLPTRSGDPAVLTLIDRFRTDVITRIDPATGKVLGQLKTHRPNDDSMRVAYSSNPQDYVYLGPHDAWVSRYEPNASATADDPDRGLDLLHIDPTDLVRGERIDLWSLNSTGERRNPDTGETQSVPTLARPQSIVRIGDYLVVGIANLSAQFDAIGEGMVALVNLTDRSAVAVPLPGLGNCAGVDPVPESPARVVVGCTGFYRGVRRDLAGLALLELRGDALHIEQIWRGVEHPEAPLAVGGVVALGGSRVVAVADGKSAAAVIEADGFTEPTDVAYVVDLATCEHEELFRSDGSFTIGGGAFSPRTGLLLVPDASTDGEARPTAGVRRFRLGSDGRFDDDGVVSTHAVLPARRLSAL